MLKLYYGTTEKEAKASPIDGLRGHVNITNVYAPFQALLSVNINERWGIVEILWEKLKFKNKTWKSSIEETGIYSTSGIPPHAIGQVWIYDPSSNWLITREVLHIKKKHHNENLQKMATINRWLIGEYVAIKDFLGNEQRDFTQEQQTEINACLTNRNGLDLYHH